jgi:hypothetical protein
MTAMNPESSVRLTAYVSCENESGVKFGISRQYLISHSKLPSSIPFANACVWNGYGQRTWQS